MHFLCNPYAVPMLYCKFHTLFKNHTFLRNGKKQRKKCIRFCVHCASNFHKITKEKSWDVIEAWPEVLVKCVDSTNRNGSNKVSFLVLWGAIFGVKKDTSPWNKPKWNSWQYQQKFIVYTISIQVTGCPWGAKNKWKHYAQLCNNVATPQTNCSHQGCIISGKEWLKCTWMIKWT